MRVLTCLAASVFTAVVAPNWSAGADWPPGPRFTSAGRFVENTQIPPIEVPWKQTPMSAKDYQCPEVGDGASWTIGGHVNGLSPAIVTAEAEGPVFDSGSVGELSQAAIDLVPALPGFMRDDFRLRMTQIPLALQEQLVQVLGSLPVKHLDEAAFLVAHLSLEDLLSENFDPWILKEIPADIYAAGEAGMGLGHAALVEKTSEDGGVDWTTVRLRMDDGSGLITDSEVPGDVYYWYVVHPKLDHEPVQLTVPDTGKPAHHPEGATWREYYMFSPDGLAKYTDHFLFHNPAPITNAELQGWGPSAATVFKDMKVGPLELVRAHTGLTTIEFRVKAGTIIATTMLIEKAAANGKSRFLENCIYYGKGNIQTTVGMPHLVVQEHNPFGKNTLGLALDDLGIKYDVADAGEFATMDLQKYTKIIVPSDQPRGLYEAIAARRDDLETWIGTGRVFELHGATSPGEDWSGVVMPGGFTIEPLDGSWASDEVEIGGWPHLSEVIPGVEILWDCQAYGGLSGDRFFDAAAFALDRIGWFTSQNLFDNVAEQSKKHPVSITERSVQAVRVLYNHYGNCGELQDVVTAAARTSLIPMMNVGNPNEDHVWNEFYSPHDDEWHTFQVSWSDGITIIDNASGAAEKLTGGGKDISMVQGYRGDGFMLNRTPKYSDTWTLDMNMTDKAGRPLDGALVMVASETYYPDPDGTYPLAIGFFGHTDKDGRFTAELGDAQNFYIRVISKLGTYPTEANKVSLVANVAQTVPGITIELNGSVEEEAVMNLPALPTGTPGFLPGDDWMRLDLSAIGGYQVGVNPLSGDTFSQKSGDETGKSAVFDVYVLDDEGLAAWKAGEPASALWGAAGITKANSAPICGPTPANGKAHVVFMAPELLGISTAFTGTMSLHAGAATCDEASAEPSDFGKDQTDSSEPAFDSWTELKVAEDLASTGGNDCSMGNRKSSAWPSLVLLILALAVLSVRPTCAQRRVRKV